MSLLAVLLSACDDGPSSPEREGPGRGGPPNILFMVVDDLGVADVGAYGGQAGVTPHIDQLAREGARFTRHYTESTCTASRVGILTGMAPPALGFRPNGAGIPAEVVTIPELLRDAGYSTHHIGKWHAGYISVGARPNAQGFDTFFGFLNQFFLRGPHDDGQLRSGRPTYHNPWLQRDEAVPEQYQGHLSDLLKQRVLTFLDAHATDTRPWFLNYWTYAPHHPLEPAGRFAARHEDTPRGRYLALVEQMDAMVGEVLQRLEKNGLADNTLVIVASDNGGTGREYPSNAPFDGGKASFREGGVRTPMLMRWPGRVPGGVVIEDTVSIGDYLPTLAGVAGVETPRGLQGRNLMRVLEGEAPPPPRLFWEVGNSIVHSWAALSPGGKWRLFVDFEGTVALRDLEAGPGGEDVSPEQHAELVRQMTARFTQWRVGQREVPVRFERRGASGVGQLHGYDFLRAPGNEGWTFGLGVAPDTATGTSGREAVIAEQGAAWSLRETRGRWNLSVLGVELDARAPPSGQCTEVLVGAYFSQALSAPGQQLGIVELFYNGRRVAGEVTRDPPLPLFSYSQPTLIGGNREGGKRFAGVLGTPTIWNERLVEAGVADPALANGVNSVAGSLCPPARADRVILE